MKTILITLSLFLLQLSNSFGQTDTIKQKIDLNKTVKTNIANIESVQFNMLWFIPIDSNNVRIEFKLFQDDSFNEPISTKEIYITASNKELEILKNLINKAFKKLSSGTSQGYSNKFISDSNYISLDSILIILNNDIQLAENNIVTSEFTFYNRYWQGYKDALTALFNYINTLKNKHYKLYE